MIDINKYDYFIFDCDGVILDSNELKSGAFAEALPNESPDLVAEFVEYHKKNGGISRYEKFRYYFENMKNSPVFEKDINNALEKFSSIVIKGLVECEYIDGVLAFIIGLKKKNKKLYVVSGSDQQELINIFSMRCINNYFDAIYGSPNDKIINTRKVISTIDKKENGIFLGDSKTDYDAANKFGLDFLFLKGASEWKDGVNTIKKEYIFDNFLTL